jgi:DNA repair protein RadC
MKPEYFINEVTVQYKKVTFTNQKILSSADAAVIAREVYQKTDSHIELKEYFFILLLNRANEVIGYNKLSEGGIGGTVVDLRLAYSMAIKSLASAIVLVHNHPSGKLTHSEQDLSITKQFIKVGKLLEIQVLDHVILAADGHYSFADNGWL